MFDFLRGIAFRFALVLLTALYGLAATRADAQQTALVVGNHSPSIERLAAPHPAPADQSIQMSIALNPTNRTALEVLQAAQQDPRRQSTGNGSSAGNSIAGSVRIPRCAPRSCNG